MRTISGLGLVVLRRLCGSLTQVVLIQRFSPMRNWLLMHDLQSQLALARCLASVKPRHPAKWPGCDSHLRSDRNLAAHGRGWGFRQLDVAVSVDHRLEAVDLMIGTAGRTIASPNQAQDAESAVDRPPPIDDAAKQIPENNGVEARFVCTRAEKPRSRHPCEAARRRNFALGKTANDGPI